MGDFRSGPYEIIASRYEWPYMCVRVRGTFIINPPRGTFIRREGADVIHSVKISEVTTTTPDVCQVD